MKYDYVMSALGFAKMFHWREDNEIEAQAPVYINECLRRIQGRNNHNVSVLFNAYAEKDLGLRIKKHFTNAHDIYGDSGGLQVVSRGFTVTDGIKDNVYETQAKYASIGFCFDQIPVEVAFAVSNPNFIHNRLFVKEDVEKCARATARNIKRQIDVFDQQNSDCKPNVIMQGNDYDSFQRWAEYIVDELGPSHLDRCSGMALADTAHGIGLLDDIERMFYGTQMQVPDALAKHIHLLGVGRARRLLPIVIFAENGMLPRTERISYDSSTHTRALTIGYHCMDKMTSFDKSGTGTYLKVEHDIITKTKELFDYDIDPAILRHILLEGARSTHADTGERKSSEFIRDMSKTCASAVLVSVDNFNKCVITATHSDEALMSNVLDSKKEFFALKQVRSADDFRYWYNHCGKNLKSQKVKVKQNTNMVQDIFG